MTSQQRPQLSFLISAKSPLGRRSLLIGGATLTGLVVYKLVSGAGIAERPLLVLSVLLAYYAGKAVWLARRATPELPRAARRGS